MNNILQPSDRFVARHIGSSDEEVAEMLQAVGVDSLDQLIDETIPANIRLSKKLELAESLSENQLLLHLQKIAENNRVYRSFIGLGYYKCVVPPVIQRNILENPGWYTQYTPYQAEIAQGRLEALLNFQTLISDLTQMEIANASLLDEATAAAEAMAMFHRLRSRKMIAANANTFAVSKHCFSQTIAVLTTRAAPLNIDLKIVDMENFSADATVFGALLQYPAEDGHIVDYQDLINKFHNSGALVAVATDLLSLTLLTPPGELGADAVFGNSQVFGVPYGYGGPHAAFFATREKFKRTVPGRLVGVSIDRHGDKAYRLALQTREQHIRREKATSNICTAQALLAIMASMYAVYHGPQGIKNIARRVHNLARSLEAALTSLGYTQLNQYYFHTLKIKVATNMLQQIRNKALEQGINFRYFDEEYIGISLDEATQVEDLENIIAIFAHSAGKEPIAVEAVAAEMPQLPSSLLRNSRFLQHPVFNTHHSETKLLRYMKTLENRDLSLAISMIALGSCTMKLNPTAGMVPVSWAEFADIHPFVPVEQARGYLQIFRELERALCEITGFKAVSFQPNSGAQGEYAGLMVIRAYHLHRQQQRHMVLIPSSAHGTNPASATMAGMKMVIVKCDDCGNIDVEDLQAKAQQYSDQLAGLMITYPSTHGVFETQIQRICQIIHEHGGQVYLDGANMNAQVGLSNLAIIGADVCHLNLHKTFAIPHGGGGPGMGPICVAEHLAAYLPGHPLVKVGGDQAISAVAAAPWGSPSILPISYAYIRMLGSDGCTEASRHAILNANYIKSRLEKHYQPLYTGLNGRVAHEMILDMRPFKDAAGITVEDIAKRLMDYNFHAPTISWPVAGTMMIEPTESESKVELDRFCEAMIAIRQEIQEIADGSVDRMDNVLKNAPHTLAEVVVDNWEHPYSRSKAVYPLPYLKGSKFWPPVARIDNVHGDRNLLCTCPD